MSFLPKLRTLAALALALAAVMPARADGPLQVVATTGMIADIAARIGGSCAEVRALMGPGTDPHLYRATPSDVRALSGADLILYNGFALEGQLGSVLGRLSDSRPVIAVAEQSVPARALLDDPDEGGTDPHVWMDARLWAGTAPVLAQAMGALRPACAEAFSARAAGLEAELAALDGWIRASLAGVPETARVLVTAHDAFGYYGAAYGLEVAAIQGISTEAEASIADIRETADLVVERGIRTVFVESTVNPRTISALAAAVADRGGDVTIGAELFADAMGPEGTPEGSYIGMMRANTRAIVDGLGGSPAPWPAELGGWAAAWGLAAP